MRRIPCPACLGDTDVECDVCWDARFIERPNVLDRAVHRLGRTRAGVEVQRRRRQVARGRALWRDRHADTIAWVQPVQAQVLDDEPHLRSIVDHQIGTHLTGENTPLGWRRHDLRWSLANVVRAVRGDAMLPLTYADMTSIQVTREGSAYFEQNVVLVRAERTRRPVD